MFEIPLSELLDGLSLTSRDSVDRLVDEVDVDYLVAFESSSGQNRRLVAVGPTLEYTDIGEVSVMRIEDMSATFYANVAATNSVRRLSDRAVQAAEEERAFEQQAGEDSELRQRLEAEIKLRKELELELEALKNSSIDESALEDQLAQVLERNSQLDVREEALTKMEEDMMSRMHGYMEKVAELEQWEENLNGQESRLKQATQNMA